MISVIIPNYNKGKYIRQTLQSVCAQNYVSQILVIDDCSTDESLAVIKEIAERDCRIEFECLAEHRNGSYCRNRGLNKARGEFVVFLDSDDILSASCSESRLSAVQEFPGYDMWIFPMQTFQHSIAESGATWRPQARNPLESFLAHQLPWSISQPIWRRAFVTSLGGFDETFPRLQDVELHTRALLAGARVKYFPNSSPDCFYRVSDDRHAGNLSSLADRHLNSAIYFYDTFLPRVPAEHRRALTGTLFMCLTQQVYWWRGGRISAVELRTAVNMLVSSCAFSTHKAILRLYAGLQERLPIHLPGLRLLFKQMLRV